MCSTCNGKGIVSKRISFKLQSVVISEINYAELQRSKKRKDRHRVGKFWFYTQAKAAHVKKGH